MLADSAGLEGNSQEYRNELANIFRDGLGDGDPVVRWQSIAGLGRLSRASPGVVPPDELAALLESFANDDDSTVRLVAGSLARRADEESGRADEESKTAIFRARSYEINGSSDAGFLRQAIRETDSVFSRHAGRSRIGGAHIQEIDEANYLRKLAFSRLYTISQGQAERLSLVGAGISDRSSRVREFSIRGLCEMAFEDGADLTRIATFLGRALMFKYERGGADWCGSSDGDYVLMDCKEWHTRRDALYGLNHVAGRLMGDPRLLMRVPGMFEMAFREWTREIPAANFRGCMQDLECIEKSRETMETLRSDALRFFYENLSCGENGAMETRAVSLLRSALNDGDERVRDFAVEGLKTIFERTSSAELREAILGVRVPFSHLITQHQD